MAVDHLLRADDGLWSPGVWHLARLYQLQAPIGRTEVLGFERMDYELTPDAIALALGDVLPVVFEIGQEREFGRGERI